jgi:putative hydrolase of the HAD superfamily
MTRDLDLAARAPDAGKVETLFLDAGGVLVHPNWARVSAELVAHGVCLRAEALTAADLRAKHRLDTPEIGAPCPDDDRVAGYLNAVLAETGTTRSAESDAAFCALRRYHAERNLWEWVPEDVAPSLDRLRRAGLRLAIVSNANGTLHGHMDRLGLAPYFEVMIDSHQEGVEKPDPAIFERALARAGARPETTLHLGDLYYVDVVGARAAGLGACLLDPGDLYGGSDCERVVSLSALADAVLAGLPGRWRS